MVLPSRPRPPATLLAVAVSGLGVVDPNRPAVFAEAEARRRGADDAVFVTADGIVLEGPVTNVWWRREQTLYTPALDLGILAGVTRAALMEEAPRLGYEVREGSFPLEDLRSADEAFTSSSVREVLPVVEVDGRELAHGPAAATLQTALRNAALG